MTKQDQQLFRQLIKESTIGVLTSKEGKEAFVEILRSKEGKEAFVEILRSREGQDALVDSHVEYFHDVIVPEFEDITKNFNYLKGEIIDLKTDVSYLKQVAIKREEVSDMIKK